MFFNDTILLAKKGEKTLPCMVGYPGVLQQFLFLHEIFSKVFPKNKISLWFPSKLKSFWDLSLKFVSREREKLKESVGTMDLQGASAVMSNFMIGLVSRVRVSLSVCHD